MPHILSNKDIEVHIHLPSENYKLSRFDWTGKIVAVKFKGKQISGVELANAPEEAFCGKGFYNEFGIDSPLGFDETEIGGLFHKIGIGLLKKDSDHYNFHHKFAIQPAEFQFNIEANALRIKCHSQAINGYAYSLEKEIRLTDHGFTLNYHLENLGEKPIVTNEYNHNFLCIDHHLMDKDYRLEFSFELNPAKFQEVVNPEEKVAIGTNSVTFNETPKDPFFFSNMSGGEIVNAKWTLENLKSKIGISETGDFQTNMINLWGWGHVISPELFFSIHLEAGQSLEWSRNYDIYEL